MLLKIHLWIEIIDFLLLIQLNVTNTALRFRTPPNNPYILQISVSQHVQRKLFNKKACDGVVFNHVLFSNY